MHKIFIHLYFLLYEWQGDNCFALESKSTSPLRGLKTVLYQTCVI